LTITFFLTVYAADISLTGEGLPENLIDRAGDLVSSLSTIGNPAFDDILIAALVGDYLTLFLFSSASFLDI
jgi:hypothetical protein